MSNRTLIQLKVEWSDLIPGLKEFIYIDAETNEIVDIEPKAPKLVSATANIDTRAATPSAKR